MSDAHGGGGGGHGAAAAGGGHANPKSVSGFVSGCLFLGTLALILAGGCASFLGYAGRTVQRTGVTPSDMRWRPNQSILGNTGAGEIYLVGCDNPQEEFVSLPLRHEVAIQTPPAEPDASKEGCESQKVTRPPGSRLFGVWPQQRVMVRYFFGSGDPTEWFEDGPGLIKDLTKEHPGRTVTMVQFKRKAGGRGALQIKIVME